MNLSKMVTPVKYSRLKIFTSEKYSLLKNIHPEKYSSLQNINPWKILTPEKYSLLKKKNHSWKIFTLKNIYPVGLKVVFSKYSVVTIRSETGPIRIYRSMALDGWGQVRWKHAGSSQLQLFNGMDQDSGQNNPGASFLCASQIYKYQSVGEISGGGQAVFSVVARLKG